MRASVITRIALVACLLLTACGGSRQPSAVNRQTPPLEPQKGQVWQLVAVRGKAVNRQAEPVTLVFNPEAKTVSELLEEYVSVYGVNTWAMSTYEAKKSLIYNYINPMIGDMQLKEITPRTMDASITYKLKLNGGDIKAVQGDSGHAQVKMVTDVYSHILDDDRRINAQRFEEQFYRHEDTQHTEKPVEVQPPPTAPTESDNPDLATLGKLLSNPEMAALIKALAKNL